MKYIDSEKLIAEIERLKDGIGIGLCEYDAGEENGKMEILTGLSSFITSLQQEQLNAPKGKFNFPKFLYARTLDNKTIDISYAPQTMEAIEYVRNDFVEQEQPETPSLIEKAVVWFNNIAESAKRLSTGNVSHLGPTIVGMAIRSKEFLEKHKQEQPEVDLDAEIAIYLNRNVLNRINNTDIIEDFTTMEAGELARHFYELGLNARKEEL